MAVMLDRLDLVLDRFWLWVERHLFVLSVGGLFGTVLVPVVGNAVLIIVYGYLVLTHPAWRGGR